MPFLGTAIIEPGALTNGATDGALLDAMETFEVDALNLRPECITERHFKVTRDDDAGDGALPITSWLDQVSNDEDESLHEDESPGTYVAFDGDDLELVPSDDAPGLLETGNVLRWHFSCMVSEVDPSGDPVLDGYFFAIEITGEDSEGTATKSTLDTEEFGIVASYSMNQGGLLATPSAGAIANRLVARQRVSFSGIYIHDPAENVFSVAGTDLQVKSIKVRCWVQTDANKVTLTDARLFASIHKG